MMGPVVDPPTELKTSTGAARLPTDHALKETYPLHNGAFFLNPAELTVTQIRPKRLAFVGSCLLAGLGFHRKNPAGCAVDLLISNNADSLPEQLSPGVEVHDYDFQVIQIPLRGIFFDGMMTGLDFGSTEALQRAFDETCDRLRFHLHCRMEWNIRHGLLTFVCNFLVPQRNPMGSLFPKHDLRNPEFFVMRLNEKLEEMVRGYKNAYILDLDRISASIGRRFVQDDIESHFPHASLLPTRIQVENRIEPIAPMAAHYEVRWPSEFLGAVWTELMSMFRIVRQTDAVKMVVVDLDDTLWHGVSGDLSDIGSHMLEGWPTGLAEALAYLKKRGILLAIISKNEESRIREIWPTIFRKLLSLDDFAAIYINWDPKSQNMQQLLDVVNLLPRNVVFIDDNPAERAAMSQAFPDMRIIGQFPYYLRRTLLWSAETQIVSLSDESARRTEMIQAQVQREGQRKEMSREDFLRVAAPSVTILSIPSVDHPRFSRVFELVNKTNQFNTTGRRWTREEFGRLLAGGATVRAFEVTDTYTDYGLAGVVIVKGDTIEQWVMSCRILGYQIEDAVMASVIGALRADGYSTIFGRLVETDVNFPCRSLYSKTGFVQEGDRWILHPKSEIVLPDHITLVASGTSQPVLNNSSPGESTLRSPATEGLSVGTAWAGQQGPGGPHPATLECHSDEDGPIDFSEEWYLRRYPDVALAVTEGRCRSGLHHYLTCGRFAGRLPLPPTVDVDSRERNSINVLDSIRA